MSKLNDDIRRELANSTFQDDEMTNHELNAIIRGTSLEDVRRSRRVEKKVLTDAQIHDIANYVAENNVSWNEATQIVMKQKEADPKPHEKINDYIRDVRKVHMTPEEEKKEGETDENK